MGATVVVIEKRDSFSRNNVLHLWPYTIHDLRGLGAKKFYGKFCAGAIDHISKHLSPEYYYRATCFFLNNKLKQGLKMFWVCSQHPAESTMCASLFHRYSATAVDPAEGRLDRCSGVSHQCWICQLAGTSRGSGKWRYSPPTCSTSRRPSPINLQTTHKLLGRRRSKSRNRSRTRLRRLIRLGGTSSCSGQFVRKIMCSCTDSLYLACHCAVWCSSSRMSLFSSNKIQFPDF